MPPAAAARSDKGLSNALTRFQTVKHKTTRFPYRVSDGRRCNVAVAVDQVEVTAVILHLLHDAAVSGHAETKTKTKTKTN